MASFDQRARHMRAARGSAVGERKHFRRRKRHVDLIQTSDHLVDAVLADGLELSDFSQKLWVISFDKVPEHVDLTSLVFGRQFSPRHELYPGGLAGHRCPITALYCIMVG